MTNHLYFKTLMITAALAAVSTVCAQEPRPVAPGDLKADVQGIMVNLSWEWGNAGDAICTGSFEEETFSEPWSVKNCYSFAPETGGNWMIYDFSEYPDDPLNHDGSRAALLMMAQEGDGEELATFHQDEWLMVRPGTGAVYMDFWYFLYPELREVGGYPDFPDHYYVMISRDNGTTWSELWDGRWDMGPQEGVQQASLFLGEPTDENTLVAFNAVSGEEESLYFLWAVDDVRFYNVSQAAERSIRMSAPKALRSLAENSGLSLHREFKTTEGAAKTARRSSPLDWLNGGNTTYRVYLDGEMIADYLKARNYTDYSTKEPGQHEYSVMAWSESEDVEYDAASVTVAIDEFTFEPARNIKASYTQQADGKYTATATWEAPEGDVKPDHYNIFVNGRSIGWLSADDELEMGQTGLYKGAYTFSVVACYTLPDGESEPVYASTFPGTVPTPRNLTVTRSGNDAEIAWKAPLDTESVPVAYSLYRGTESLGNLTELTFTDRNVPEGNYSYSVHAVYAGEEVSLPVSQNVTFGNATIVEPPYSQTFATAHLPEGWSAELTDPYERVKDMYAWRFDNWFDIEIPAASGIQGCFASVSGVAAGMNRLETSIQAPKMRVPEGRATELSFDKYYYEEKAGPSGSAQFNLQISADGGLNWNDTKDLAAEPNGRCTVDLGAFAGQIIQLRWSFLSRNSGVAAIDNVEVREPSGISDIMAGSDKVFDVYTAAGITVAHGITTDAVSNLPAGLYILRNGRKTVKIMVP